MPPLSPDSNIIRWVALLIFVISSGGAFYLYLSLHCSLVTLLNLIGIIYNFIGTLWIASGVYLFFEDKRLLSQGKVTKSKFSKKLAELLEQASRQIPIGIAALVFGVIFQVIALLGAELKWF